MKKPKIYGAGWCLDAFAAEICHRVDPHFNVFVGEIFITAGITVLLGQITGHTRSRLWSTMKDERP